MQLIVRLSFSQRNAPSLYVLCSIYYNVPLHHLVVAGKRLLVDPAVFDGQHGTIIDSGTTYCYLPGPAFDVFVRAVSVVSGSSGCALSLETLLPSHLPLLERPL